VPIGRWVFGHDEQEWVYIPESNVPLATLPFTGAIDFSILTGLLTAIGAILIFVATMLKKQARKK